MTQATEIGFTIEACPVSASRPRVTSRGIAFYPKKHTTYASMLKEYFKNFAEAVSSVPVEARFLFVMPRYKTSDHPVHRTDVDNLAKLPMDSMTKSEKFWTDDDLIVDLKALKRFVRDGEEPHTKVRVIRITGSVEDHVDAVFNS